MPETHDSNDSNWSTRERILVAWDRTSVRVITGVLVAVVLLVALLAIRTRPVESATVPQVIRSGTPVAARSASGSTDPAAASAPTSAAGNGEPSGSQSAAGGLVVVHVTGPVRQAGVYTLSAGARVADAVAAAGGMAKGRARINLARVLIDGEQIDVGAQEEPSTSQPTLASGGGQLSGGAAPGPSGAGPKVSLNKATATQLEQLPRVGPVMASKIIEFRTQHGGFRSVDQLREVPGIGDATFAQIAPHVAV